MATNNKINFKSGMFYVFIANVLNMIISLFSGFVLPKYLSVETYADIKLFQLYITYIGILHLGFADGMYLRLGGKNIDEVNKEDVKKEFGTFKSFQIIVCLFCVLISFLVNKKILIAISLVILPINISNYIRNLYNACGQYKKYSFYTNINTVILFILNVFLLFIIKTDVSAIYLISYIIMYFVYWIFVEYENAKLFGRSKLCFEKKYFVEDIKTGFILMFGNFCNVIFTSIDRLFVQYLLGKIKFAFYSFAVSIENLLNVFISPISIVMYNYFCNNKSKDKVVGVKKTVLVFSIFLISVIFGAKFIVEIWLNKYTESLVILFILIAAQYVAVIIRCVHINLYKAFRKQNRYFVTMVVIVVLSVIFNVLGYVLYKDAISIAVATLLTNIIWFIVGEIDLKKYRMPIIDYIVMFVEMVIFLFCGLYFSSIVGFIIYIVISLILVLIFECQTFLKLIDDGLNMIKKR